MTDALIIAGIMFFSLIIGGGLVLAGIWIGRKL